MGTKELIKEIQQLPVSKRLFVIEQTINSIRELELKDQLVKASESLLNDYGNDKELTALTDLDFENFYEARWYMAYQPWSNGWSWNKKDQAGNYS